MRITYIKLENVAGISVGMNKEVLEINFDRSVNKIVAIQAKNGTGKSVLLSSLTPFAYLTSLDERSTLPYITPKKNGYKEIHYQDGKDEYIIKHYFKATKETHSVKSYFMKNGEELNENGNVETVNLTVSTCSIRQKGNPIAGLPFFAFGLWNYFPIFVAKLLKS